MIPGFSGKLLDPRNAVVENHGQAQTHLNGAFSNVLISAWEIILAGDVTIIVNGESEVTVLHLQFIQYLQSLINPIPGAVADF